MPHHASFDSSALSYASDDNYDAEADAYDGSSVKIEPSAGQAAQGIRPGRQIAGQHFNWLINQFSQILSDLIDNDVGHETRLDADEAELANHEERIDTIEDWIANHSPRLKIIEFLGDGTFVVPARCVAALSYGCGGGGAGGSGANGDHVVDRWMAGAGGGGGALASMQILPPLIAGETLTINVGGAGLFSLSLGGTGGDGGDTLVKRGTTVLARHTGGAGGRGAVGGQEIADWNHFSMGGTACRSQQILLIGPSGQGIRVNVQAATLFGVGVNGMSLYFPMQPAQGGFGAGGSQHPVAGAGSMNPVGGFAGGAGGVTGLDGSFDGGVSLGTNPTRRGGGPGGGGGAGPFGAGGAGGFGQNGDPDGGSEWTGNRTNGFTAAANSGAGGGGAGSNGWCNDVTDVGANNGCLGGDGGSGRCYIILVLESA